MEHPRLPLEMTRQGRMTVFPAAPGPDSGTLLLRCPALKQTYPSVLLPALDETHFVLTDSCRLFFLGRSWTKFLRAQITTGITGKVVECVNPPVASLIGQLNDRLTRLDALFGSGSSAAAEIVAQDPRLGIRELRAALAGVDAAAKRNRAQAIVSFPLLYHYLDLPGEHQSEVGVAFTDIVDQGKPLLRELPRLFSCKPWVIRHLRGKGPHQIEPYVDYAADMVIQHMAWLTPERAPDGYGQFNLLSVLSSDMFDSHRPQHWIRGPIQRSILRSGWPEFGTRFNNLENIVDYACFVEYLARGITQYIDDVAEAVDDSLGRPTLKQVEHLSNRWHDIEAHIRAEQRPALGLVIRGSWKPLFEDVPVFRGYSMRCLKTHQELVDEGQGLNHCVSNYFRLCEAASCHIVGITQGSERVATAELRLTGRREGKRRLIARQISGWRNADPEREVVDAVQDLLKLLEQRDLSVFPHAEDTETPAANGPVWVFERTLELEGAAGLERYRACLQPNVRYPKLWDYVAARCGSGRISEVTEMSRFEAHVRSITTGL